MELARIEVGRKYICAFDDKQYFATVQRMSGEQWVAPDRIHEM
jgi:hypothetical protein